MLRFLMAAMLIQTLPTIRQADHRLHGPAIMTEAPYD
jgi:hypothetical protein